MVGDASSWHFWLHELWHPLKSLGYQFWSGVESAIQSAVEKFVYGAVAVGLWWHRSNCHEHHCWRTVKHGQTYCKKHRS